ncbi:MAG: hypothetical protein NTX64_16805 [Elusimicrobia bacterium]|nr:hypothetical protein [Elusimicrobiota bacterium]
MRVLLTALFALASLPALAANPFTTGQAAVVVVGQASMSGTAPNQGGASASATTLNEPYSAYSDGTKLYVVDQFNRRVLIYNSIPSTYNTPADVVVGQPNMSSGFVFATAADTLSLPYSVFTVGTKLLIADTADNRVLIYNTIPTSNDVSADVVVGQPDTTSSAVDQGAGTAANTLDGPTSVYSDGTKLFVADATNHRVLIYNTIPTSNNVSANVVIGQPDMTHDSPNQGGSAAANTLDLPSSVYVSGTKLFISDLANNRVLIYNTIPTSNNASADVVVGQPNMTSPSPNPGGSAGATTLSPPYSVYYDGTSLFVTDYLNNRVLKYLPAAPPIPPPATAPAVVAGTPLGASSITWTWSAVTGATSYNLYYATNPTILLASLSAPTLTFTETSLSSNTLYSIQVAAVNAGGTGPLSSVAAATTLPLLPIGNLCPPGGSVPYSQASGLVTVTVPAGVLPSCVTMTLSSPSSLPCTAPPPSRLGALRGTGVTVQIDLSPVVQPSGEATVSMVYRDADVAGMDQPRLVIARCDASGVWVPLQSSPNPPGHVVTAQTNHFSIFQLMGLSPAADLSGVNVFPNPLRPAHGDTAFTFSNLPAQA